MDALVAQGRAAVRRIYLQGVRADGEDAGDLGGAGRPSTVATPSPLPTQGRDESLSPASRSRSTCYDSRVERTATLRGRAAALCAALVLASLSAGPSAQDGRSILPKWRQGDIVEYRMIRTRNDPKGALPDDVATTPVTLTVVSASEQGFLVEWKQSATTGSLLSEQNAPTREMLKLVQRVPLMLEISPNGQVTGLSNWEAVRAEAYVAFDNVFEAAQKLGTTPGLVERAGPEIKERFSTKEAVWATLTQDAQALLVPMGQPAVASDLDNAGHLRNPLGGAHFPASVRWTAQPSSDALSLTRVRWTHTVSPEISSARVRELITAMLKTAGRPMPDLAGVTATASGEGSAEVNLTTGWPEFVEDTVTVVMNGRTTRDKRRFERVRPGTGTAKAPEPPRY